MVDPIIAANWEHLHSPTEWFLANSTAPITWSNTVSTPSLTFHHMQRAYRMMVTNSGVVNRNLVFDTSHRTIDDRGIPMEKKSSVPPVPTSFKDYLKTKGVL